MNTNKESDAMKRIKIKDLFQSSNIDKKISEIIFSINVIYEKLCSDILYLRNDDCNIGFLAFSSIIINLNEFQINIKQLNDVLKKEFEIIHSIEHYKEAMKFLRITLNKKRNNHIGHIGLISEVIESNKDKIIELNENGIIKHTPFKDMYNAFALETNIQNQIIGKNNSITYNESFHRELRRHLITYENIVHRATEFYITKLNDSPTTPKYLKIIIEENNIKSKK